ncbi:MAG: sulfotransferase domain-containing protein, partial [Kiloniellales bacterium]
LQVLTSWSNHVRSWTQTENPWLMVLRYEDMLDSPQKSFGRVARFLGLDPPRDRLKRAIKFSSFKVLRRQEDRHGFRERSEKAKNFFRKGTSGQWKTALTAEQVARIVGDQRQQMQRFGYLPPGF